MRDYRKGIVAALGVVLQIVAAVAPEAWPEGARPWVAVVLAAGTAAGVYGVRNGDRPRHVNSGVDLRV